MQALSLKLNTADLEKRDKIEIIESHNFYLRLEEFIQNNYHNKDLKISHFCTELEISRTHLHRKIKQEYKKSTTEYINDFRIQKAKALLEKGNYNKTEVARLTGFNEVGYFTKLLKKY